MGKKLQEHWEMVYTTKKPEEVSWTEDFPKTSLDFIHTFQLSKNAKIIDIGGGDSKLVDYLLAEGFENITVLDISAAALERAKNRLGEQSKKVNWIVSDVTKFNPESSFDVWHDRAAFHFLTTEDAISQYLSIARKAVSGYLTIGTFSDCGPKKCSGLPVKQYSEEQLSSQLSKGFHKLRCITEDHITPFKTVQNFLFCSFSKKPSI
ncbi:MAG: hypothetical protein RLZZ28_1318 [Bacteroidota bacterium]|jgi:SAM-dependent methyltransferase